MPSFSTENSVNKVSSRERAQAIIEQQGTKAAVFALLLSAALLGGCDGEQAKTFNPFTPGIPTQTVADTPKTEITSTQEYVEPTFENIKNLYPGLSIEDIKTLCRDCLPHPSGIHKLSYVAEERAVSEDYGITGHSVAETERKTGNITFNLAAHNESLDEFFHTFFHESGHALNNIMSPEAQQELHDTLTERINDSDRYYSRYVESINNSDKNIENYHKTREYFAEIYWRYVVGLALAEKDSSIIEDAIKTVDPSFNVEIARTHIQDVKEKVQKEREKKKLHPATQIPQTPPSGVVYQPAQPQSPQTVYIHQQTQPNYVYQHVQATQYPQRQWSAPPPREVIIVNHYPQGQQSYPRNQSGQQPAPYHQHQSPPQEHHQHNPGSTGSKR